MLAQGGGAVMPYFSQGMWSPFMALGRLLLFALE